MSHITQSHTQSKLSSISQQLNDIAARVGAALQSLGSGTRPAGPVLDSRPTSGPGSRLTDTERQDVITMGKRPDLFTVKQISDKHRISRAAVYLILRAADLTEHKRGPWASQVTHPLDKLLSH